MSHVRVFRKARSILAESLVWDASRSSMLWCDISTGRVHTSPFRGIGESDATVDLPAPVGSFGLAQGGYVVSLGDQIVLCDSQWRITRGLAQIEHAHSGMRLNEGKVDPSGRWITGSMDVTRGDPDAAFYSVTATGAQVLYGGVGTANGLEWSLDGTRVYFTDTSVMSIYTGRYTKQGEITDVETFHHGSPHDGLTIDNEGCLWSANYGQGTVVRYSPTGAPLLTIELPAPNVTSVAFGGDAMSTLFVASAREKLGERQLAEHPLSGSVFAIDTEFTGRQPFVFGA